MTSSADARGEGAAGGTQPRMRWVIAIILCASIIAAFFDRISIAVLFENKTFQSVMGTGDNRALLGLLMTVFVFAYGFSSVFLSFLGDIFGPRRCLAITTTLWGVFMGLMGTTSSYAMMLVYRVCLGLTEGPQFALVNAIIRRWFPNSERGGASALWLIGSPLGSAIGFPLTIFVVINYGWRASFFTLAAINIVIILPLILAVVRNQPASGAVPADVVPEEKRSYRADLAIIIHDWRYWMLTIFNSAILVYLWGFNAWLPSYLQAARHFNPRELGFFSSLPFILIVAGEVGAGFLSDRIGRRAIIGFLGLLFAGILMYLVSTIANPYAAAVVMALSAGCWGMSVPMLFALTMQISPSSVTATAVGAISGMGNLVGAVAPVLMGFLITRLGSFDAGLMVLVVTSILGSCAMLPFVRRY